MTTPASPFSVAGTTTISPFSVTETTPQVAVATENGFGAAREVAGWHHALDSLAARLAAQAAFLGGEGAFPEGSWTPPAGPLPHACRERAIALLAESQELERQLEASRRTATPALQSPYR